MRTVNEKLSVAQGAALGLTTGPVDCRHLAVAVVQCVWAGGTPGIVKLQGSADHGAGNPAVITNWTDVASATITPSGATGTNYIQLVDFGWAWLRAVVASGGSGSITITMNGKGA